MLIDASHDEETRVVVVESNKVEEFDFESLKKLQLSGNIYLAKVTRVEPSLQAAFLDYGGNRHGFLAFSEIHPDYYQIPLSDRDLDSENTDTDEEKSKDKPVRTRSRRVTRKKKDKVISKPEDSGLEKDSIIANEKVSDPDQKLNSKKNKKEIDRSKGKDEQPETTEADIDELKDNQAKKLTRKFRIQEVIKVRQILLIQVIKEERGNKGAALTTYLSLAGRYCVLMPNTPRGGGISRKITNLVDRKKLKEIANSLLVPEGSGLIIRTAGSNRTKIEIKRDYEYLLRQWEQVRDLTLTSIAPTPIYEEGSLIKRSIRDLYSRTIDEVLVDGERGYKEAKDYMKMLMPSHAKNVKRYEEHVPLFTKFQVEEHLAAMFNPVVQLKSGGYIVIGVTEALVAVDVNSGKATKESSIEETALKTNLEAADELARQLKLRDLAGLIVVDFIDMEDRKNNLSVEKRMKERLKNDRARTQIGRISIFGLLEMSRQRLRPGMIETTTQACNHCHGTGITRSDDSLSIAILRQLEEEAINGQNNLFVVKVPVNICNYMLNEKRNKISILETRYDITIKITADTLLINPEYIIDRSRNSNNSPASTIPANNTRTEKNIRVENKNEANNFSDNEENSNDLLIDDQTQKKRRRRRRKPKQKSAPFKEESMSVDNEQDTSKTKRFAEETKSEKPLTQPQGKQNKINKKPLRKSRDKVSASPSDNSVTETDSKREAQDNPNNTTNKKPTRKSTKNVKIISSKTAPETAKESHDTVELQPSPNKQDLKDNQTDTRDDVKKDFPKRKGWWTKKKSD